MPGAPKPRSTSDLITCPNCRASFPLSAATTDAPARPAASGTMTVLPPVAAGEPITPTSPLPAGHPSRLGRFEITRYLGEGAFGRVYEAKDLLKRTVALKVAKPEHVQTAKRIERFQREARAAANLLHPNIVAVFDSGSEGPYHYIASAFVSGRSLAVVLEEMPKGKTLDLRVSVAIVRKLAEALASAHKQGVIHRDVKPANVMLRDDGEPLLMDFGLAARSDETEKLTVAGQFMGTPEYTAPEQWRGQAEASSDQYSLGLMLFELLTGERPFSGASTEHYLLLHTQHPAPSPRKYRPEAPRDLETICLKCLEKEPARRYPDCQSLADDLRRWLEGEPITARRVGPMESGVRWVRRRPLIAALSATVVVAMAAGTSVSIHFGRQAREKENKAVEYADALEKQEKETRRSLEEVEENLAVGLLRPVGHLKGGSLNDFERDALEELACLPRQRDRVRVLFLARALEKPETAGQLGRRLESALIAAVALREDLRQQAMHAAATRLEDGRTPRETKVVCARLLARLRCQRESWSVNAANTLLAEIAREEDPVGLRALADALSGLANSLSAEQTGNQVTELANRFADRGVRTSDPGLLSALSEVFASLSSRLPPKQSARQASALANRVIEVVTETTDPAPLRALGAAFVSLANRVPDDRVTALANSIVIESSLATHPESLRVLADAFASLAGRLPGSQVPNLASRIVDRAARTKNVNALRVLMEAFAAVAVRLPALDSAQQAGILAARIVELAAWITDSTLRTPARNDYSGHFGLPILPVVDPSSLSALSDAFAALAGKLSAKQAAALAGDIVEQTNKKTDLSFLVHLSKGFAVLAGKLSASQAATLAGRIVELASRTTDPSSRLALSQSFAVLVGKLSDAQASDHASALASHIVELAGKTTDPSSLRILSEAFTAMGGKRKDSQAAVLLLQLARCSHRDPTSKSVPGPLAQLVAQVSSQTLLDALKQPGCVGPTRAVLLDHLARRYKHGFSDVWGLVGSLREHAPTLDLDSPILSRKESPQPQRRNARTSE
jgi:tRNA A-37 threonylcarbamoyl transferase component Bud32